MKNIAEARRCTFILDLIPHTRKYQAQISTFFREPSASMKEVTQVGAWRSLVAHLLWEQRVVCSNHTAPTITTNDGSGRTVLRQRNALPVGAAPRQQRLSNLSANR